MIRKPKRVRHLKFRTGRIEARQREEKPMARVYLGTVTLDDSAPNSLVIPALDLTQPVEVLQTVIAEAEAKRAVERVEESKRLRTAMGLLPEPRAADEPAPSSPWRETGCCHDHDNRRPGPPAQLVYLGTFSEGVPIASCRTNSWRAPRRNLMWKKRGVSAMGAGAAGRDAGRARSGQITQSIARARVPREAHPMSQVYLDDREADRARPCSEAMACPRARQARGRFRQPCRASSTASSPSREKPAAVGEDSRGAAGRIIDDLPHGIREQSALWALGELREECCSAEVIAADDLEMLEVK